MAGPHGDSYLHLAEVVQLHGGREVEQHVGEVGALVAQLVQHGVGDELDGELDVAQRGAEPDAATKEKHAISFLNRQQTPEQSNGAALPCRLT